VDQAENKINVLKQRLVLMEKMLANDRIEDRIAEVSNKTQDFQQCLSPELLAGIKSNDFKKIVNNMHQQLGMLRRQLAQYERERLLTNYDRIPKDIEYLTKTEVELRKELALTLQSAEESM
jgi:hypothetical protein